jgi:hypothetical protein
VRERERKREIKAENKAEEETETEKTFRTQTCTKHPNAYSYSSPSSPGDGRVVPTGDGALHCVPPAPRARVLPRRAATQGGDQVFVSDGRHVPRRAAGVLSAVGQRTRRGAYTPAARRCHGIWPLFTFLLYIILSPTNCKFIARARYSMCVVSSECRRVLRTIMNRIPV